MNINARNTLVKLFAGIFILLIINMNSFPYVIANRMEDNFNPPDEENTSIEASIIEGAGYFLKGNSTGLVAPTDNTPGIPD